MIKPRTVRKFVLSVLLGKNFVNLMYLNNTNLELEFSLLYKANCVQDEYNGGGKAILPTSCYDVLPIAAVFLVVSVEQRR
jgi:hypothetical protein